MKEATSRKLSTGFRYLLGILFIWAAVSKLANPLDFLAAIYGYELPLPEGALKLAAISVPWAELMIGLMLVFGVWTETAVVAATAFMGVFLVFTGQAWLRGLQISCGCFNLSFLGIDSLSPQVVSFVESVGFAFVRNLVLAAMAAFLFRQMWAEMKDVAELQPVATKSIKRPARASRQR